MAAGEALDRENADGLCRWLWQHGEVEKAELLQAAVDAEERVAEIVRSFEEEKKTLRREMSKSYEGEIKALREQVATQDKLLQVNSSSPASRSLQPPGTGSTSALPGEQAEKILELRTTVQEQSNQILTLLQKTYEDQDALDVKLLLQRATDAEAKSANLEAIKNVLEAKLEECNKSLDDDREDVRRHLSDVYETKQQQINDIHSSQVSEQADRIARLQNDLEEKEQLIAKYRQEVAQKDAQFARLQADTAEIREGQHNLLQRVMQRTQDAEAKAAEYSTELEAAKAELRNLMVLPSTTPDRDAADALTERLGELQAALEEKQQIIDLGRRRLGELQAALEEKEQYIGDLQAAAEQARLAEAKIPELVAEAAERRVQALESNCLQQETLIAQLEGTIAAKDARVAQLREAVAEQEKQLTQTQALLSERDLQLSQLHIARSNAGQECTRLEAEVAGRDHKLAQLQASMAVADKRAAEMQARAEAEQATRRSCMGQTLEADKRVAQLEILASRAEAAENSMRVRMESTEANIAQLSEAHVGELEALRSKLSEQFEEEISSFRQRARLAEEEMHRIVDGNLNARSEMDRFEAERDMLRQTARRAEEEARRSSQDHKKEIDGLEAAARQALIDEARRVDELIASSERGTHLQAEEWMVQNLRGELAAANANAQERGDASEENRVRDLEEERELLREQMAQQRVIFEGVLQDLHQKMRQSEDALLAVTLATANDTRDAVVKLSKDNGTLQHHLSEMRRAILTINGHGPSSFVQRQQSQSPLRPMQRAVSQMGGTAQSRHGSPAMPSASPQMPPLPLPSRSCAGLGSRNASVTSNQEAGSPLCGAVSPVCVPIAVVSPSAVPHAFRARPTVGHNGRAHAREETWPTVGHNGRAHAREETFGSDSSCGLRPLRHTAYSGDIVRASTPPALSTMMRSPRLDVELL